MKPLFKRKESPVLLGLALDGGKVEGVLLRRTNGSVEVAKTFSAALTLDLLNNEPELVGQEIKNHLEAAGIRERRCVVCVPLKWALTLSTPLPELPEEDVPEFLQIEAERGFSLDLDALLISRSIYQGAGDSGCATQVGISLNHLTRLEKTLAAAGLKPASFTVSIAALQATGSAQSAGVLALSVGADNVDLQVTVGGGVVALRSLGGAIETEGGGKEIDGDYIARELRITLGQLPAAARENLRSLRVFGSGDLARHLVDELKPVAKAFGLNVELVTAYGTGELGLQLPAGIAVSAALSAGVRRLAGQPAELEFLPPKISAWQQFSQRYSSRKLMWSGATAGAVAVLILAAFLYQQYQIYTLETEWKARRVAFEDLKSMQEQIRKYRPWFDTSFTTLTILRKITEAFPEDGSVTAKTLEIRNLATVNCTGTVRDLSALGKTQAQLQKIKEFKNVRADTVTGDKEKRFSLNFQFGEGGTIEN